jgi:hypothetical protein
MVYRRTQDFRLSSVPERTVFVAFQPEVLSSWGHVLPLSSSALETGAVVRVGWAADEINPFSPVGFKAKFFGKSAEPAQIESDRPPISARRSSRCLRDRLDAGGFRGDSCLSQHRRLAPS